MSPHRSEQAFWCILEREEIELNRKKIKEPRDFPDPQGRWTQLHQIHLSRARWWVFPFSCPGGKLGFLGNVSLEVMEKDGKGEAWDIGSWQTSEVLDCVEVRLEYEGNQQLVRLTVRTQHGEASWMARSVAAVFSASVSLEIPGSWYLLYYLFIFTIFFYILSICIAWCAANSKHGLSAGDK